MYIGKLCSYCKLIKAPYILFSDWVLFSKVHICKSSLFYIYRAKQEEKRKKEEEKRLKEEEKQKEEEEKVFM